MIFTKAVGKQLNRIMWSAEECHGYFCHNVSMSHGRERERKRHYIENRNTNKEHRHCFSFSNHIQTQWAKHSW